MTQPSSVEPNSRLSAKIAPVQGNDAQHADEGAGDVTGGHL
jgi:hypothetical protein